jgi:polysaccharide export outer membrane protein
LEKIDFFSMEKNMREVKFIKKVCFILMFCVVCSLTISAQENGENLKVRDRIAKATTNSGEDKPLETDKQTSSNQANDEAKTKDDKTLQGNKLDDAEEIEAYYSTYMKIYRLGPEDVISVRVFGQCPDYCRENLTIPPTARISYPLIRGGIFVAGKTIEQIESEITKKLDEYIIDPDVTVELVKVGSARYNVLGKVINPGEHLMTRRISIFDAIAASGGIADKGDKNQAVIYRPNAEQKLVPIIVNIKDIQEGKTEMAYLSPGDQVYIPKQGFKFSDILDIAGKISVFRLLLGSPL